MGRCDSTGDPHIRTFDNLTYSIYTTGNFQYARNLDDEPVEVSFARSEFGFCHLSDITLTTSWQRELVQHMLEIEVSKILTKSVCYTLSAHVC